MASLAEKAPEDAPIEISMFKAPECFLYKVPPLKIASGHRAEDWGLGSPQLTGRVEIVGVGTTAEVRVFKQDDGAKPVAVCPVRCAAGSPAVGAVVDDVVDSSRYFVLRLEDAKKRKAYLGLGFRERDVAYDFKATLCDFKRSVDREEKAEADHADYERRQADGADPEPEVDMSLKGRIKISLGDDDGDRPERPKRE
ncbi:endocytosis associated protein, partial [Aureococcus anophagefferens]